MKPSAGIVLLGTQPGRHEKLIIVDSQVMEEDLLPERMSLLRRLAGLLFIRVQRGCAPLLTVTNSFTEPMESEGYESLAAEQNRQ